MNTFQVYFYDPTQTGEVQRIHIVDCPNPCDLNKFSQILTACERVVIAAALDTKVLAVVVMAICCALVLFAIFAVARLSYRNRDRQYYQSIK